MVEIPMYERDDSNDYLAILRSLNEIPFPVGRNLLGDFLIGDMMNKSIAKNNLYDLHNFSALENLDKNGILGQIENLIMNGLIDESTSSFNKFIKVLGISMKGQQELINPKLNSKKIAAKYEEAETQISDREMQAFKELGDFLDGFNMEQKKAIVSPKEKILCIAGAGSGKTTVLTKRVEFLNRMKKVRADEILAITFTRKAKEEMERRLSAMGINANIQTFNSFCERILLKYGGKIYGKRVRVAGYSEKMMGLMKALEHLGIDFQNAIDKYFEYTQKKNKTQYQLQNMFMNDCYSVLEYYKSTRQALNDFSKTVTGKDYENAKMIYNIVVELDKFMRTSGLRTYADQLRDTVDFFKRSARDIPKFQHILVDEYQDVNSGQVELLDLLNAPNLFAVGDPRQSIFGWRGSDVNYILDFKKKFTKAEVINLKKNYRSNSHVVRLMNKSIKDMKMPDLEHDIEGEKQLKLYNFTEEEDEFDFIYRKISSTEVSRNNIFVLGRTNRQLADLSEFLKKKEISHMLKNESSKDVEAKEGEVVLSTIHAIKGLEAEMVFVIGATAKNFPCKSQDHPVMEIVKMYEYDREEEERRLFYVAISRAKNQLYITYSGKKPTYFVTKDMLEDLDEVKF
ncbi:MAG: exodeoxyribonuclease V subunit gamma [Nanoarchaeota archaeon]|jgi:superfamily I DNA/RNA helicase|nr:exodeoxyribonuclease V subunit gamma [Nanoarchaeota archaeon]